MINQAATQKLIGVKKRFLLNTKRFVLVQGVIYRPNNNCLLVKKKIKSFIKIYSMNWIEVLSIVFGNKKPELIPIPVPKENNQAKR